MLDKARSQSKHMDESNAAASLLSMETTANNHHYLHNKTSRATLMNSSQDGKKHAEDEVSDGANSRHPTISSASIESLKTTYDENPLLSIMKSTCAPNNTPVHTPSGSPSLKVQSGGDIKDDPKENDTTTTTNTTLQDRRDSDNAVHAAASPLAPSNTPSILSHCAMAMSHRLQTRKFPVLFSRSILQPTRMFSLTPPPPLIVTLPLLLSSPAPKKYICRHHKLQRFLPPVPPQQARARARARASVPAQDRICRSSLPAPTRTTVRLPIRLCRY